MGGAHVALRPADGLPLGGGVSQRFLFLAGGSGLGRGAGGRLRVSRRPQGTLPQRVDGRLAGRRGGLDAHRGVFLFRHAARLWPMERQPTGLAAKFCQLPHGHRHAIQSHGQAEAAQRGLELEHVGRRDAGNGVPDIRGRLPGQRACLLRRLPTVDAHSEGECAFGRRGGHLRGAAHQCLGSLAGVCRIRGAAHRTARRGAVGVLRLGRIARAALSAVFVRCVV